MANGLQSATAETIAREYVTLLDEGWEPELEEFLHRVPDDLRDAVSELIDRELANRDAEDGHLLPDTELVVETTAPEIAAPEADAPETTVPETTAPEIAVAAPVESVSTRGSDGWVRLAAHLVPADIRHHWLSEHLADRADARRLGFSRFELSLLSSHEVLNAIAQHAPLRPAGTDEPADGGPGWTGLIGPAWRLSGLCLFLGVVTGTGSLLAVGALFLFASYGGLIAVHRAGHWGATQVRTANSVFAGTLLALGVTIMFGLLTTVLMGVAVIFGWSGFITALPGALVFLATLILCVITVSGWAPQPWCPKRIFRV